MNQTELFREGKRDYHISEWSLTFHYKPSETLTHCDMK